MLERRSRRALKASAALLGNAMTVKRMNYRDLSAAQRQTLVNAFLKMKKDGNPATGRNYDTYVNWHLQMMQLPMSQMRAHMSPMFLPWHREFVRLLEMDLQAVSGDATLAIPYWDWADPTAGPNEPLWAVDFMGGNGRASDLKVMTGPFAFDKGNWPLVYDDTGMNYLSRSFGSSSFAPTLPRQVDVNAAVALDTYDVSPWDMTSDITQSFRNNLEGWGRALPSLHNQVHIWVGGDRETLQGRASPNDPVFFLHHSNIDRIWGSWQDASTSHTYLPATEQANRPGVSLNAAMPLFPTTVRPSDVLDYRALGYEYAPSAVAAPAQLLEAVAVAAQVALPATKFRPFVGIVST